MGISQIALEVIIQMNSQIKGNRRMKKVETYQESWIGIDLDKTLAYYEEYTGIEIGEPIPKMQDFVLGLLHEGKRVKIFTARACSPKPGEIKNIQDWCLKHLGQVLEVTCIKDRHMYQLYDDRAFQVIPNTGEIVTI